jgi:hypothetical protein
MTQDRDEFDSIFEDRPTGETIRVTARGISPIGDKPVSMVIEFELPDNAQADDGGIRRQAESTFHAMFGARALHVNADGEQTHDLLEAFEVEISGAPDYEAAEAARDQLTELLRATAERQQQEGIRTLVERAYRPPTDGPSLN